MIYEITIDSTHNSFIQETTLDGVTYRLLFRWNAREEYWYMSLFDIEDVPLSGGIKLVAGCRLLRHLADYTVRPPGELIMLETPTRTTLGQDALLVYLDEDEVSA